MRFPLVIGASTHVEADTLEAFIADAKAHPEKYSYASTGLGSLNHLAPEELKRMAGFNMLHVPFSGGGPAMQSLLGNVSDITFLSYAALKSQIAAGQIKPLAVTGDARIPGLPHVPTVQELGYSDFEAYSWIGIFARAGTPDDVADELTRAFQKVLGDEEVKARLTELGFEVMGTDGPTVDRYAVEQYERWNKFVQETGLSLTR